VNLDGRIIELCRTPAGIDVRLLSWRREIPGQPGAISAGKTFRASAGRRQVGDDGFAERVEKRRVDLVKLIREGLPPIEYLPESAGMLVRGKRHLIAGPRKSGKSLSMLAHWVRMALSGARVLVFDRENGALEYAGRLHVIATAWDLSAREQARITRNLCYYDFPKLKQTDAHALQRLSADADVVVFDGQRMFLSEWGLKEDDSDSYAVFMQHAIDPLFQGGVATVILDNTGHRDSQRARGSSSKGDLNEVLFEFKAADPFSVDRQGRVQLVLPAGNSRFGNEGVWDMRIGGGAFGAFERVDGAPGQDKAALAAFRTGACRSLEAAGKDGLSQKKLFEAIRQSGVKFGNGAGRSWLYEFAADPNDPIIMSSPDGSGLQATFYLTTAIK
jgi:hypothetical protein